MTKEQLEAFKSGLKDLMNVYGVASIEWECADGSDTHGIHGENMIITTLIGDEYVIAEETSCICAHDL